MIFSEGYKHTIVRSTTRAFYLVVVVDRTGQTSDRTAQTLTSGWVVILIEETGRRLGAAVWNEGEFIRRSRAKTLRLVVCRWVGRCECGRAFSIQNALEGVISSHQSSKTLRTINEACVIIESVGMKARNTTIDASWAIFAKFNSTAQALTFYLYFSDWGVTIFNAEAFWTENVLRFTLGAFEVIVWISWKNTVKAEERARDT